METNIEIEMINKNAMANGEDESSKVLSNVGILPQHSVTTQKTSTLIFTTMKTSNLA
jgi:hypothetical protein